MNTTISVIGCGWLGLPLGAALAAQGHLVSGTSTSPEKLSSLKASSINPFLFDINQDKITETEALWLSNIFIITVPPGRGDSTVESTYPKKIARLLRLILTPKRSKKPWIIFCSSTGVYGKAEGWVDELSDCNPDREGARAIYKAEQILKAHTGIYFTILRFAGLVGANRPAGRFFAGKEQLSSGSSPVNLIHRDDCIAIICQLIAQDKKIPILNLCSDEHPTHRNFYPKQAVRLGLQAPTYGEDAPDIDLKIVDNSFLKRILSYTFIHPDPMEFPI